jgi:hypothetical protein
VEIKAELAGFKAMIASPGPEQIPRLFVSLDHDDNLPAVKLQSIYSTNGRR